MKVIYSNLRANRLRLTALSEVVPPRAAALQKQVAGTSCAAVNVLSPNAAARLVRAGLLLVADAAIFNSFVPFHL